MKKTDKYNIDSDIDVSIIEMLKESENNAIYNKPLPGHRFRFLNKLRKSTKNYFGIDISSLYMGAAAAIIIFITVVPVLFVTGNVMKHENIKDEIIRDEIHLSGGVKNGLNLTPSQVQQVLFNLKELGYQDTVSKNVPTRSKRSPKA